MTETPPNCPECAGIWLYGLTHQHRLYCPRYAAETATIAADHKRGHGIRDTTETERLTIQEHDYEQPADGHDYYIRFSHGGVHHREVLTGPSDTEPRTGGLYWWGPGFTRAERATAPTARG